MVELLLFVVTTCVVCGGSFNERHKKGKINEDTWFRNTQRKAADLRRRFVGDGEVTVVTVNGVDRAIVRRSATVVAAAESV